MENYLKKSAGKKQTHTYSNNKNKLNRNGNKHGCTEVYFSMMDFRKKKILYTNRKKKFNGSLRMSKFLSMIFYRNFFIFSIFIKVNMGIEIQL